MNDATAPPRAIFGPMFGMALLFALIGPLVGAAIFIPLAFWLEAPAQVDATAQVGWVAALIGHTFMLVFVYLAGFGPAAATGALFGLCDRFAPPRWPRWPMAAAIGGLLAQLMFARLAALGAWIDADVRIEIGGAGGEWFSGMVSDTFDEPLRHAFVASGAIAAFVCALTARLIGLTGRRQIVDASRPS